MLLKFQNTEPLDIIYINDEPFFKAKDVCNILGFKNSIDAVNTHCESEGVVSAEVLTRTGIKTAKFINEANLYALIFNVPKIFKTDSEEIVKTKQKAKEFQKWVFNEVLPDIRKNGYFSLNDNLQPLSEYTKRDVQIQASKTINALQFALGGVEAVKQYNRENCKFVTGMETKQVKSLGKKLGLKSKQTTSAKEVLRNIPELKSKACTMTLNDTIISKNPKIKLEKLQELDKNADKVFQNMLDLGINPAELNK
jgi:prophage antirepressor-like protein